MIKQKILLPILLLSCVAYSQVTQKQLIDHYKDFGISTREVAYVHLNKSTYIKNEMIGFKAYIFDKAKKQLLPIAKNLYCTISDKDNKIIKSKLIKIKDGITFNTFNVDSTFTSGIYTFRAYTNWMLNFKENNFHQINFKVIDPELTQNKKRSTSQEYTLKLFPEGGHLLNQVKNNLAILVKNKKGRGIKNATGKIITQNKQVISEFALNNVGIAKVSFTPLKNQKYKVIVANQEQTIQKDIQNIKDIGINMALANLKNKIAISFKTNSNTFDFIKQKKYILAIHNGKELKTIDFDFGEKKEITKIIRYPNLYSGINIFTVFDTQQNKPILERLFFNPIGIYTQSIDTIEKKSRKDISLMIFSNTTSLNKSVIFWAFSVLLTNISFHC